MARKEEKTNVMRLLDKEKVAYAAHEYDHSDGAVDGVAVAQKLGQNPAQVFKTLVTRGAKGAIYVFCVPVDEELDLKKAARAADEKSIEPVHVKELLALTGYIRGGCSPIGMKKQYPTFIDETAQLFESIGVSAGARGEQLLLAPTDLAAYIGAKFADLY